MPFTPVQMAAALGLPLVVCLVGFVLASRGGASRRASLVAAFAVAIALPGAMLLASTSPKVPPVSATDWPPVFALAGGVAGLIGAWALGGARKILGLGLFVLLHVGLAGLVAGAMHLGRESERTQHNLLIAGAIVLGGTLVSLSFRAACASSGRLAPLLVVLVGVTTAVSMALTGNLGPPLICGSLCACVGPAFLVALRRPEFRLGAATTGPAWTLAGLCIVTTVYGETPWWCAGLNALAGVMVWASGVGPLARLKGWKSVLVRGALVAAPGIAAVVVALMNQPEPYG